MRIKFNVGLFTHTQGNKNINQYEHEFTRLLQFAPDAYRDCDELKKELFLGGLEPKMRCMLIGYELSSYNAVVKKAWVLEGAKLHEQEQLYERGFVSKKRSYEGT